MPYADPLTETELTDALRGLPGWEKHGDTIARTIACADFRTAIALVGEMADAAEAANHHPDIAITRYRHVTFTLTTHAAKAVTRRDVELAAEIDRIAARIGAA